MNQSDQEQAIAAARDAVSEFDRRSAEGNLEAVMGLIADDIVVIAEGSRIVRGAAEFRAYWGEWLTQAKMEMEHRCLGADAVGDTVSLYGECQGQLTWANGNVTPYVDDFLLVLRGDAAGARIWRYALVWSGTDPRYT